MVPFLVAFLLPIFLILIFNVVVYVLIIRVIILHTVHKKKRMNMSPLTTTEAIKMLLSYTGIMTLFGLTWLFGVFTFITEPNVSFIVQFFFAFFNTFQGFFIFLFFVLLNGDSRNAWKSLLCPHKMKQSSTTAKTTPKYTTASSSDKFHLTSQKNDRSQQNLYSNTNSVRDNNDKTDNSTAFKNSTVADVDFYDDDEFMKSEFKGIRFERHLTTRRQHYVERIEVDFHD